VSLNKPQIITINLICSEPQSTFPYPVVGTVDENRKYVKKMVVFWDVAPCSLAEVYQRFRGPTYFWFI
jgi:hypothetical protein